MREDFHCIIETEDGTIVAQPKHGVVCPTPELDESYMSRPFLVFHQEGITKPEVECSRSCLSILSPYCIKINGGVVNVPWKQFSWCSPEDNPSLYQVDRPTCGGCMNPYCIKCKTAITFRTVKVVWIADALDDISYQWYTTFKDDPRMLVCVPKHLQRSILQRLKSLGCRCGNCEHPLTAMLRTCMCETQFRVKTGEIFAEYKNRVRKCVQSEKSIRRRRKHRKQTRAAEAASEKDTCAICFDETTVRTDRCLQNKCKLSICERCHQKTRGMCPLCDRAKLSNNARFVCHSCQKNCKLDEFGFECFNCGEATVCKRCWKGYGQCITCEQH